MWLVGSCSLPPQTPPLWFSPFLAVSLCLTPSPPFVLPSLLLFYWCFALRSLCLLAIGLPCFVCSVSVIYLALLCLSSCLVLLWSWVWCLVFLAVDWSRISSAVPLQFVCFLPLFACVPSLAVANWVITTEYHIPRKDSSVVFLAVDWSGVSPCWPPNSYQFSIVSGRRLDQGLCHPTLDGSPYKAASTTPLV